MTNPAATPNAVTFLGFFLAGLVVNLTPCVYPMLTVTASLFKPKQAQGETLRHSFLKALAYFFGIAVMYSALGYFAASTGKVFGSALQNSWVLGGVSLMMFVLALSMFGLFELRVPSELLSRLGGLRKANYAGLFASGMFVGVFAAPCIGPPVLALLAAVADNGNPQFGLAAFFTFSCGLGLPYLLLGTFSGLVTHLPKAGNWLIWIERIFGVVLLGFSIFYLALALHLNLPSGSSASVWKPYSEQAVSQSIAAHKPVIIDYFAEWCIGCQELDHQVFPNPAIAAKLKQITALRIDATNIDNPDIQQLIDKYSVIGLPTVIFLDDKGEEIKNARVEGAGKIKEFLKSFALLAEANKFKFKE